MIHRCTSHGKTLCIWCFAQTAGFPIEHFAWTHAPLLRNVSRFLGV